ncbi:DUF1128 domain-containing protein [Marinicrinis lubricantis]|uniref:UPF0435 protein ACFPXP_01760 n=1 Tax=Marinicrinis lubricantis TaxID=2086470 RepID=A0ABW1IJH4_9BACL
MDLNQKSTEHAHYMIEEIKKKLKVVSLAAIKPSHFDEEQYDDLKDIYDMVSSKSNFSISEMEAIVSELGRLRKT